MRSLRLAESRTDPTVHDHRVCREQDQQYAGDDSRLQCDCGIAAPKTHSSNNGDRNRKPGKQTEPKDPPLAIKPWIRSGRDFTSRIGILVR